MFRVFQNRVVSFAVTVACILFIIIFFVEKTKIIFKMTPMLRGEVDVNNMLITTMKDGSPIVIKKDDPNISDQLRTFGTIRTKFNRVLSLFYRGNSVVIEIGPQFGYNTISLAKGLNPSGTVYAFEANSRVCTALKKTMVLNEIEDKVVVRNIAISDKKGTCDIPDCLSIVRLPNGSYSEPRIFSVSCSTLDEEMLGENRPVDLIAVDIADMEVPILKSCESIIERSPEVVIVSTFDNDPVNPEAQAEFLKLVNKGFNLYIAKEDNTFSSVSVEELMQKKQVILVISKKSL